MQRFSKYLMLGLLCMSLAILLGACDVAANRDIPLNLKEANVNEVIQNAALSGDSAFRIDNIDMKDGYIRVFMAYRQEDGTDMSGSYDVALKLDNGQIRSEISNVNMPGLVLDQQILDQIAELITRDFVFAGSKVQGQVEIVSLITNEDGLQMVIRVNR
jgi:hypothetical protein